MNKTSVSSKLIQSDCYWQYSWQLTLVCILWHRALIIIMNNASSLLTSHLSEDHRCPGDRSGWCCQRTCTNQRWVSPCVQLSTNHSSPDPLIRLDQGEVVLVGEEVVLGVDHLAHHLQPIRGEHCSHVTSLHQSQLTFLSTCWLGSVVLEKSHSPIRTRICEITKLKHTCVETVSYVWKNIWIKIFGNVWQYKWNLLVDAVSGGGDPVLVDEGAAAPGPIRGEYCCHVTRSPPITAHLWVEEKPKKEVLRTETLATLLLAQNRTVSPHICGGNVCTLYI